ncbi:MAG: cell division protein ZapA [Bacteroidaceae bacterium]|nr:cell division protein ZapA [Bacteroidaceae bacterium]MBQ1199064.1 cell division protein ZapA [Bacteroidaceae bacterium]MBQ3130708.1 cell division protein ZapA [Bacteroidaceae bacterium]MBR7171029.1 cell division protein ZapA [Prevotella sp.]MEE0119810.1 cell division protein ZapA [Bacteroidaceae bacterium]
MEDKQKITIRFGSWDLPMTVLRKDEHLYREAEKLMKERYAFYTRSYKGLATERYMVMCMLDIAVRLQHALEHNDSADLLDRLTPLAEEIEKRLER